MMIFLGRKVRILMNKSRLRKEEILWLKVHDKFVKSFKEGVKLIITYINLSLK